MVEGVIGHVVLQIKRLVSNVKYPATITLSRTEILTPNTLTIACIQSYDDHAYHITVTNRLDSYDSLDQPSTLKAVVHPCTRGYAIVYSPFLAATLLSKGWRHGGLCRLGPR